ncbi:hypothetical protein QVD99_001474 [Batrachochytrium dendrobatidis]|nr:hypothetical protein O5D80_005940 [Batrachochytrium dendrobatidis]KAK5671632.1 hypothetical protein QVD99_001474 [Batrachochytrium dendrobatidis]
MSFQVTSVSDNSLMKEQNAVAYPVTTFQQAWSLFEEGVIHMYGNWTALTLAYQNASNPQILSAAQPHLDLVAHTIDYFRTMGNKSSPTSPAAVAAIAETLAANLMSYFEDMFEVEVEDGSPYQIAKIIALMYQEIFVGRNAASVVKLRESSHAIAQSRQMGAWTVTSKTVQDYQSDDSDSDSDTEMENQTVIESAAKEPHMPIIDEDGFETVVRKKGGRR